MRVEVVVDGAVLLPGEGIAAPLVTMRPMNQVQVEIRQPQGRQGPLASGLDVVDVVAGVPQLGRHKQLLPRDLELLEPVFEAGTDLVLCTTEKLVK